MGRYKGVMSAAVRDRLYPFQVPLRADHVQQAYFSVMEHARNAGACDKQHSAVLGEDWHEFFCFENREAAEAFAKDYGAEVKDARNRVNKTVWNRWEEKTKGK